MDHVEFDDTHTHTYIHTRMRVRTQNHPHSHMHEYTHTQYHDLAVHAHYHSFDRLVYICPNASDPKSRFEMPNSSDSERLFARPMGTFMNAGSAVPLASAAQARAIHQLLHGHTVSLRFCRPVIPSSCSLVIRRQQVVNTSSNDSSVVS
mmetsp:Transcript_39751/g.64124  ORF Transcript_39751/g.64124 Transcript_39751/m.64124 type:complete len:149 (-) Transcript_39751:12-458(-)